MSEGERWWMTTFLLDTIEKSLMKMHLNNGSVIWVLNCSTLQWRNLEWVHRNNTLFAITKLAAFKFYLQLSCYFFTSNINLFRLQRTIWNFISRFASGSFVIQWGRWTKLVWNFLFINVKADDKSSESQKCPQNTKRSY